MPNKRLNPTCATARVESVIQLTRASQRGLTWVLGGLRNLMPHGAKLLPIVQNILFREWDPIGINNNELCRDEYDSYALAVVSLLTSGADEHKLACQLRAFQTVDMGMSVVDEKLHVRVARRLLSLVRNA